MLGGHCGPPAREDGFFSHPQPLFLFQIEETGRWLALNTELIPKILRLQAWLSHQLSILLSLCAFSFTVYKMRKLNIDF